MLMYCTYTESICVKYEDEIPVVVDNVKVDSKRIYIRLHIKVTLMQYDMMFIEKMKK